MKQNEQERSEQSENNLTTQNKRLPKREIIVGIIAILFALGLSIAAICYKDVLMSKASSIRYSILGILVISFLAGSILSFAAIPVPYWLLVFTLSSVLAIRWGIMAPVWVGLASATGATLGHLPTFLLGYGGRSLSYKVSGKISDNWYGRWFKKITKWSEKHGWIAVFLTSALFNPIHLPMTVAFGTLHYSPWKYFIFSFLGNIVKSMFLAFAGYFGLTSLLKLFGLH